jgi:hypothetical protein
MSVAIDRLYRGILSGAIVGFLHTIVADGLIGTLMTGRFFYAHGGNIIGVVVGETVKNIILGGVLGALGAYIAITIKK